LFVSIPLNTDAASEGESADAKANAKSKLLRPIIFTAMSSFGDARSSFLRITPRSATQKGAPHHRPIWLHFRPKPITT
jgi:hypothetical protein